MSVSTGLSRLRQPQKAFFFTCKWGFTPEAKDIIETRFGDELQRRQLTAHLSYDYENHLFTVAQFSCTIPILYKVFQKVIDDFILEQLGEDSEYEEIQSNLIFRITPLLSSDENQLEGPFDSRLIEDEGRAKWSCPKIELFVDHVFHEKLLQQIGKLTSCTLSYDVQSRKILIVGSFEVDCHRAIQKLDKIRDYDIPLLTNPLMNNDHCFWAEEEENFAQALLPLKTIHTLYETTLIDVTKYEHGNCYQDLAKGGRIRCCLFAPVSRRYKPIPAKKPDPAVNAAHKDDKSKVFGKYKYSSKGNEIDDPMNWVDPADHHGPASSSSWIPAEKKIQIERWVGDLPNENPLPPDTVPAQQPSMSPAIMVDTGKIASVTNRAPSSSWKHTPQAASNVTNRASSGSSKHVPQAASHINVSISQSMSLLDTSIDDIPSLSALMPALEPIRPMIEERLQKDSEVESREYHSTMRQKASRGRWEGNRFIPAPPPNYLTNPFIDRLEAATLTILDAMRGWPGEVKLVAQFGRAWVNRYSQRQSALDVDHMPWLDSNKFSRKLLEIDSGRPIVDMTDLLTTLPADIQYLIDLPMLEGKPYWNPRPTWSISYQFQCRDLNPNAPAYLNDRFMLDVDAESFAYKMHTLPRNFGDCYVHCLKRNWDYRISGTGTKDLSAEYGSFAEDLVSTLYIPPGTDDSTLRMSFELDLRHSFAFHTVRVAKKSTYTSSDGKSKLNIVEFRDMGIKLHVVPSGESNRHIYEVWVQTARDNISYKECSWFEASIVSTKAEQYFEQNKALEVGEETAWRRQDFENHDVLAALYRPACALIRQMDGVGYYNDNPFGEFLRENEKTWRAENGKGKKQNDVDESEYS